MRARTRDLRDMQDMQDMRDIAAFRTRRFVPVLPERCQASPGSYGAELAFWLAGRLARQGVVTSYPTCEDGYWRLDFLVDGGPAFQVVCGNVDGSAQHWRIALACRGAAVEDARALVNAIRHVLHAAVPKADLVWLYDAGS